MLGKPSRRTRKRLEEHGVRAPAKILEMSDSGMAVTTGAESVVANTELAMKCKLEIQPPDGTPAFQVSTRLRFPQLSSGDPVAQLEKLQALKEKGALSDAEFEQQKARILGT